ncbi:DUF1252 [Desulfonema limicola]|uniref:DUF1252 n=1 Tax=Desulfonema limicola TaxID=45656 RepID=A0A975GI28_9BACT|nr:YkvA family protein [Desulfonema limicola]QTA82200.1 DUF1252 [Desulfonema limicola]
MQNNKNNRSFIATPLSAHGMPVFWIYILAVLGIIYVLNPGSGVLEFIPDNIPFIGNLDEGGAVLAIWYGLLELLEGKKFRNTYSKKSN